MMKNFLILVLFFLSQIGVGQTDDEIIKEANRLLRCTQDWKYSKLKHKVEGKVLFYIQPIGACGGSMNASNTIIVTTKGDTIRILQVCDNPLDNNGGYEPKDKTPRLEINDDVSVTPDDMLDNWRGGDIPHDYFSCIIKETYFGDIKKSK